MKLTKVERVFVLNDNGTSKLIDEVQNFVCYVEEQNNKYILSKEEITKLISDAIQFGIRKQSSFEAGGGKNVKLIDLTNEFSEQILNKQ